MKNIEYLDINTNCLLSYNTRTNKMKVHFRDYFGEVDITELFEKLVSIELKYKSALGPMNTKRVSQICCEELIITAVTDWMELE